MAPEEHEIAEYSDDVAAWIEALRAAPEIARVDAGGMDAARDFAWLADHELLLLDGPRLDQALSRLRADGMTAAVAARRDLLTFPSARVVALVQQDPLGLFDLIRETLGSAPSGVNAAVNPDGYITAGQPPPARHSQSDAAYRSMSPSRALDARLEAIRTSIAKSARAPGSRTGRRTEAAAHAGAGCRRLSHRRWRRGARPTGGDRQYGRFAGAHPPAAVHRVSKRLAGRGRRAAFAPLRRRCWGARLVPCDDFGRGHRCGRDASAGHRRRRAAYVAHRQRLPLQASRASRTR